MPDSLVCELCSAVTIARTPQLDKLNSGRFAPRAAINKSIPQGNDFDVSITLPAACNALSLLSVVQERPDLVIQELPIGRVWSRAGGMPP